MKDNREKEPEIKVKSVKKALDVLNCFIKKQPLGVTEISEMVCIRAMYTIFLRHSRLWSI